jgi:hypothetical protein
MSLKLPPAPARYERAAWQSILQAITLALGAAFNRGQDVRLQNGERLILKAPNGTLYQVKVDNAGALSTAAVP